MISSNERNKRCFLGIYFSAGPIVMQFTRQWSPIGYDRVVVFEQARSQSLFRVVPDFLVQFGIGYDDKDL
jgi:hypothetical protein